MHLLVDKLAKYKAVTPSGTITDGNGLFYRWDTPGIVFNLREGIYRLVDGKCRQIAGKPLYRENFKRVKTAFDFILTNSTQTGYVKYWPASKKHLVYLGYDLLQQSTPVQYFVYLHELGHVYGGQTEAQCDHFAARNMIAYGFNPSQIYDASKVLGFDHNRQSRLRKYLKRKYSR
jgi:hypothetical protein